MAQGIKAGGRTIGISNRTTTEISEHFQNLIAQNLEQLDKGLKAIINGNGSH